MFKDRKEAGEKLADALQIYKNRKDVVIVAIPRGGVAVGAAIAEKLKLPLEIALVKKIGHPANPEYAIGSVSLKNHIVENDLRIPPGYIKNEIEKIRGMLVKRTELFYGQRKPVSLFNKIVIIVDDGVATGKTLLASVDLIRQEMPAKIIIAVPAGPVESIDEIKKYVDKVICLEASETFYALGAFYEDFNQLSDIESIDLFKKSFENPISV